MRNNLNDLFEDNNEIMVNVLEKNNLIILNTSLKK